MDTLLSNITTDQARIDTLIQQVENATTKGQITNVIVATVLCWLNEKVKSVSSGAEDAKSTLSALGSRVAAVESVCNAIRTGDLSDSIDNLKELFAFLSGIKDDATLMAMLAEIKSLIDSRPDSESVSAWIETAVEELKDNTGILPFDTFFGDVTSGAFAGVESGSIVFDTAHRLFYTSMGGGRAEPTHGYNETNDIGIALRPLAGRVFRCDGHLYRYDVESSELVEIGDQTKAQEAYDAANNAQRMADDVEHETDRLTSYIRPEIQRGTISLGSRPGVVYKCRYGKSDSGRYCAVIRVPHSFGTVVDTKISRLFGKAQIPNDDDFSTGGIGTIQVLLNQDVIRFDLSQCTPSMVDKTWFPRLYLPMPIPKDGEEYPQYVYIDHNGRLSFANSFNKTMQQPHRRLSVSESNTESGRFRLEALVKDKHVEIQVRKRVNKRSGGDAPRDVDGRRIKYARRKSVWKKYHPEFKRQPAGGAPLFIAPRCGIFRVRRVAPPYAHHSGKSDWLYFSYKRGLGLVPLV